MGVYWFKCRPLVMGTCCWWRRSAHWIKFTKCWKNDWCSFRYYWYIISQLIQSWCWYHNSMLECFVQKWKCSLAASAMYSRTMSPDTKTDVEQNQQEQKTKINLGNQHLALLRTKPNVIENLGNSTWVSINPLVNFHLIFCSS